MAALAINGPSSPTGAFSWSNKIASYARALLALRATKQRCRLWRTQHEVRYLEPGLNETVGEDWLEPRSSAVDGEHAGITVVFDLFHVV